MIRQLILRGVVAGALLLGAVAAKGAEPLYEVGFQVWEAGELISTPSVVVRAQKEATLAVEGTHPYRMSIQVSPVGPSVVLLSASYESDAVSSSPSLVLELGREASVSVNGFKLVVLVEPAERVR
jgi:hypothetical protein